MKKILLLIFLFFAFVVQALAMHITGGEIYYALTNVSGNQYTYHVTVKLYKDCFSTTPLDGTIGVAIFENSNFSIAWSNNSIAKANEIRENLSSPSPCISNPPTVCYDAGFYVFDVTLPGTAKGYTIAYQRCCRIQGINNISNSLNAGSTYTAIIPGNSIIANAPQNNSAHFIGIDTVVVCAKNYFCYNFGAEDGDNDSLSYLFGPAFDGGTSTAPAPIPPAPPPYESLLYNSPYNSDEPLGSTVTLDPKTGMMCGKAPSTGIYVVTVYVTEWRNGVAIAVQRKDLQIKIGDCNTTASVPIAFDIKGIQVNPNYSSCNGYDFTLQNAQPSPLIHTYYWDFGDGGTSSSPTPSHTYSDTGAYIVKLVINRGEQCTDSSTTVIHIYPGFFPGFTYSGFCSGHPTQFTDTSKTTFGTINSWSWNFGDASSSNNTSQLQNPSHTFPAINNYPVTLIVTSSKGCIDTVHLNVSIIDKPPINLAFRDTLLCKGDTLQLHATGTGVFSWTPFANMTNANTSDPTVKPLATTHYSVQLNDNGCLNFDTVQVRVISVVTLIPMPDTTICATDGIQLHASTDGLRFLWTPATGLSDPNVLNPIATPITTTKYQLTATVGSCVAQASINVKVAPYPKANAGNDTTICFSASAQLHANITGSSFSWSPSSTLTNSNSLNPFATPANTTSYILTVTDTLGCPKPWNDTVVVNVLPKVRAFAGKDTAVVVGQPLQLTASGGTTYSWSPGTALNNPNIFNPVAIYDGSFDSIKYFVTVQNDKGCTDVAQLNVKIFKTDPRIFVPTAFTPNGDGKNDLFRPIPVGISKFDYFRVYNRWGQLVFSTTIAGEGWNGKVAGQVQGSGVYVWIVQGTDFTGKTVFAKGTMTLIR